MGMLDYLRGASIQSREPSLMEKLERGWTRAGHEINTGLGALMGMAETRSLPQHMPDGTMRFTGDSNTTPRALGDSMIMPPNPSERTLAHEGVHREQSQNMGLGYTLRSLMGGGLGPLEEEAYRDTMGVGGNRDDDIADKFMLMDIENQKKRFPYNMMFDEYEGRFRE